jgi:hypothetical protein
MISSKSSCLLCEEGKLACHSSSWWCREGCNLNYHLYAESEKGAEAYGGALTVFTMTLAYWTVRSQLIENAVAKFGKETRR